MSLTADIFWVCLLGYVIHSVTGDHVYLDGFEIPDFEVTFTADDCNPERNPWQAVLFDGLEPVCSGVLVHPQWVLTTAQCKRNIYNVGLGIQDLYRTTIDDSQLIEASVSVHHPDYFTSPLANDIMLIKLSEPAEVSESVRPATLPTSDPSSKALCLGFEWVAGNNVKYLQCSEIPLVPTETCKEVFPYMYSDTMFCGGPKEDSYHSRGDLGSPLLCNSVVQGICTGINKFGEKGTGRIYVNVFKFRKWITETIQST